MTVNTDIICTVCTCMVYNILSYVMCDIYDLYVYIQYICTYILGHILYAYSTVHMHTYIHWGECEVVRLFLNYRLFNQELPFEMGDYHGMMQSNVLPANSICLQIICMTVCCMLCTVRMYITYILYALINHLLFTSASFLNE
jgi:hypothetical protein